MMDSGRFSVISSSLSHLCFCNLCLPNPAPPRVAVRLAMRIWVQGVSTGLVLRHSWITDLNKQFLHVILAKLECRDGMGFDLAVFEAHRHIICLERSRNCIRDVSGTIIAEPFGTVIKVWRVCCASFAGSVVQHKNEMLVMFSDSNLSLTDKLPLLYCAVCISPAVKPWEQIWCGLVFLFQKLVFVFFNLCPGKCRVKILPFNFSHFVLFAESTICVKHCHHRLFCQLVLWLAKHPSA